MSDVISVQKSNRVKDIISYDGYEYSFDKFSADGNVKFWRCILKNVLCKGRLLTDIEDKKVFFVFFVYFFGRL